MPHIVRQTLLGGVREISENLTLPVGAGQVLHHVVDDFNSSIPSPELWVTSGGPLTCSSSILTVPANRLLQTLAQFQPPCYFEAVATMTTRSDADDVRIGFYNDDSNYAMWRWTGTVASRMDAILSAGGAANDLLGIDVGAANNSYRLMGIYVGLGEVLWYYRTLDSLVGRHEVRRIVETSIPEPPYRFIIKSIDSLGILNLHRICVYQLADVIPPGILGHHVEAMGIPVRVVNGPFGVAQSNANLGTVSAWVETVSSLAAGSTATTSSRNFIVEQCHLQGFVMGDQPFTVWLEWQLDGTNWAVAWHGNSIDANPEGTGVPARYYAYTPILQMFTARFFRWRIKNTGTTAGTFRIGSTVTTL